LVLGYIFAGIPAYNNVLMHRFVVGEDRQKLSKSLGNYIPLKELYAKGYSADALRLSMISKSPEDNIVFKLKDVEDYTKILNVLINLGKLYNDVCKYKGEISVINESYNKWIINEWVNTKIGIESALEGYRIHEATNLFIDFLVNKFSQNYLKVAKEDVFDRESKESSFVITKIIEELIMFASIFSPLTSDYLYRKIFGKGFALESRLPASKTFVNINIDNSFGLAALRVVNSFDVVSMILRARNALGLNIKRPIKDVVVLTKELKNKYSEESLDIPLIKRLSNIKSITILEGSDEASSSNLYPKRADNVLAQKYRFVGPVGIDETIDEELLKEWEFREISRSVQDLRKKAGLKREDVAKLEIKGTSEDVLNRVLDKTNSTLGKGSKSLSSKININNKEIEINLYE
ncbi:MAG: class I tRNA ligase family protein, partial [Conexivisphaerales archaeon]